MKKRVIPAAMMAAALAAEFTGYAYEKQDVNLEVEEKVPVYYIGINADVKEIYPDSILISSDSDDFPGDFLVEGVETLSGYIELKEGDVIQIFMQDLQEKNEQGLRKYRARDMAILDGEEIYPKIDVLLTQVPTFTLTDVLSSQMNSIEIASGNYSWEYIGEGIIACGASPLDEEQREMTAKLKVPHYNKMDRVVYSFSTQIAPDILTIFQWDVDDIGKVDAIKESITTYYYKMPLLELEAGKVYEFNTEWKEENFEQNGFFGSASYVLITE